MSTLYLATQVEPLAQRLARHLDQQARTGDFFEPTTIVVPHRAVGQWLRLWLARQRGIAMNLRLHLSWRLPCGRCCGPSIPGRRTRRPSCSTATAIGCWCSACSATGSGPGGPGVLAAAAAGRRRRTPGSTADGSGGWPISSAALIRDYEYHRQDALIQHWLRGELGLDANHRTWNWASRPFSGPSRGFRMVSGRN